MGFGAGFGKAFSEAHDKTAPVAMAGTFDAMKEKIKEDRLKAEEASSVVAMKESIIDIKDRIKKSGQDTTSLDLVTEGLLSLNKKEVVEPIYKAVLASVEDKAKQQSNLQLEGYKGAMSGITEITKAMAERGGYTPEQLVDIQSQAAQRVKDIYGLSKPENNRLEPIGVGSEGGIEPIGTGSSGSIQKLPNSNSFFTTPLQPKKTDKQTEYDETVKHGLSILDETERQYNEISKKYGTGRLKGIATEVRGGLGDLIPKGERAPEVVPYKNNLEGLANFIGKTIYRDERVSDVNIKGYKKALAELTNTPEEAKIMFSTLRRYAKTGNPKDEAALRLMVPNSGKSLTPSEAIKRVTSGEAVEDEANSFLSKIGHKK